MLHKAQTALLLISLVSLIYVLRDNNMSPGTLLRQQAARMLANQTITEALCDGISQENDVTDGERETALDHQEEYAKHRDGNPLVNFIEGPEPGGKVGDEYGKPLIKYAIPFLIIFLISFVSCIYFCSVWCCNNIEWCRKFNVCKGPKPGGYRVVFTIATIVLMAGLSITGLIGIVDAAGVKKGGNKLICTFGVFADKLLHGDPAQDWVGIDWTVTDFQILLDEFYPMVAKLTAAPSLTGTTAASGMIATVNTAKVSVDAFYTTNFLKTVSPRADPLSVQTSYKPDYIAGLSGIRDAIKAEMDNKNNVITAASTQADLGINELRVSSTVFFLVLQQAKDTLANVSTTLGVAENNITTIGEEAQSHIGALSGGLIAVFAGNLILGGFAIASTLLGLMGIRIFTKLIHISWCGIIVLAVVGWALAAVLTPTTMALFEGCDVGNRVLSNATFFNETMDKFVVYNTTTGNKTDDGQMVADLLYRCYYGDGDIIDQLNLTQVFQVFRNVFEPLDDIAPWSTALGPVPDSIILPQQETILTNLKYGLVPDSNYTIQDFNTLNNLTNSASNQCTTVQDFWTTNSTLCQTSQGTVFTSANPAAYNLGNPTCIGFDAWGSKKSSDRYTSSNFPLSSCGTQGIYPTSTYVQNFVTNFASSRTNAASLFSGVQSSLGSVETANSAFMTSVKTATSAFNPVRTATTRVRQAMWDPTTGFIPNANCTFLRSATQDLVDVMCVRFGNSLYSTNTMTIVVSSFALVGGIVLFLFTWKFFVKRREERFNYLIEEHNPAL